LELTRTKQNNLFETGSHEVRGSIPLGSTNRINRLKAASGLPLVFSGALTAKLTATGRNHQSLRLAIFRFSLSFRDVEEILAMRGVVLTYETVREW
jgi:hypothetical protein